MRPLPPSGWTHLICKLKIGVLLHSFLSYFQGLRFVLGFAIVEFALHSGGSINISFIAFSVLENGKQSSPPNSWKLGYSLNHWLCSKTNMKATKAEIEQVCKQFRCVQFYSQQNVRFIPDYVLHFIVFGYLWESTWHNLIVQVMQVTLISQLSRPVYKSCVKSQACDRPNNKSNNRPKQQA